MTSGGTVSDSGKNYFPINITSLCIDTCTGFDLYLWPKHEKNPVLYRDQTLPFTEEVCQRLRDHLVSKLYVDSSQEIEYRKYLQENLRSIIADPTVDITERAQVLYSSARDVMKDLMDDPRAGNLFDRSSQLANDGVWFLFNQPASFGSLIKVTSYDYYTYTHCVNTFMFCVALARKMGYEEKDVLSFGTGALLHDVGKCMIDPEIVNCPGKLSPQQWEFMKQHPAFGCQILEEQGINDPVIREVTLLHHEKINGKGYPNGLVANALSDFVRIATIVDVFDALTTRRAYKDAMGSFPALKLMQTSMAEELDPVMFRAFIELLGTRGETIKEEAAAAVAPKAPDPGIKNVGR